jgi:MFS transporter, DHA2 family, methylenomycin A resistance protein
MDTRAPARSRLAHGTTLILLTMSLGVLIAQIDTSVVNLAVKEIGTRLGAGVTALQWVVDAYNLVYATLLLTAGPGRPLAAQSRMTGPDYDRPTATPRRGATP